jgi:hypothetical protein
MLAISPMFKSLLSLLAVLSLWTVTARAQDAAPEKPKTDDSQPAEKKSASGSETEKSDDSRSSNKKSEADFEKAKADDSKAAEKKPVNVRKLAAKTPAKATPTPAAAPAETPAPKRGFFSRVFGSHPKATPTPSAAPTATATPKARRHKPITKRDSGSSSESTNEGTKSDGEKKADGGKKTDEEKKIEGEKKTDTETKPGVKEDSEKKVEGENPPGKKVDATTPAPASLKKPRKGKKSESAASTPAPAAPVDPETAERNRFESAKTKALEDPQVQELKAKANSAVTDEEGKKALRAYNKALFNKMRKIDESLKDRIDMTESVILKHLDE